MKSVFDATRSYGSADKRSKPLGIGYYLLVTGVIGLLVLPSVYPTQARETRAALEGWCAPALAWVGILVAPLRAGVRVVSELPSQHDEMQKLRRENRELRGWQWRAQALERKVSDLRSLSRVVRKAGVDFVTAQILSVNPAPTRHSVIVNVGSSRGVRKGDAVINGDGFVGLVADVSLESARIELVDDPDVQIDVSVGRTGVLGHTSGALGGLANISVWHRGAVLQPGDEVVTSGSLPGVPRGLRVGMIIEGSSGLKVSPSASLGRLEFVSVLLRKQSTRERLVGAESLGASEGRY